MVHVYLKGSEAQNVRTKTRQMRTCNVGYSGFWSECGQ